jgi:YgiT-type zinc finger domain-containing protein
MTDDSLVQALAETTLAADLRTWRRAHPDATLTEIERELDTRLAAARAELFAQLATEGVTDAGCCPDCGGPVVRRGARTRTLRTTGDAIVSLTRPYLSCPVCGTGVFPPR